MRRTVKKYFIPHAENNYHPHILHTKRALFYSAVFLLCKIIIIAFVITMPVEVFMSSDVLANESKKIVLLTNQLRQQNILPDSMSNSKLNLSAAAKANDMIKKAYFSHTSPDNKTVSDFVREQDYNYSAAGENLAIGFATAEEVVEAWKNSPTHNANLIDKDYIDLGVNMEIGDYKGKPLVYVVEHLAVPVVSAKTPVIEATTSAKKEKIAAKSIPTTDTKKIPTTAEVLSQKVVEPAPSDAVFGRPFWENPIKKYEQTKDVPLASDLFGISYGIFLFAIIFFTLALVLSIFIEIKKQHPHIIVQTMGMIGLLAVLFLT